MMKTTLMKKFSLVPRIENRERLQLLKGGNFDLLFFKTIIFFKQYGFPAYNKKNIYEAQRIELILDH